MFNKPKLKKHRAKNNPKPTIKDRCVLCDKPYAQLHEIYFGKNRQVSIEYGLQVRVCDVHHRLIHKDTMMDACFKRDCQKEFEKTHTREEFMRLIGRNYL